MLFILSDLHLTDGSTAVNIPENTIHNLQSHIIAKAKEKNAQEIHIVLLGDIFDLVRTKYWVATVKKEERPWNGELDSITAMNKDPIVEQHYQKVLNLIFSQKSTKALIDLLNTLKEKFKNESGREINTKVTYVIGNHDRVLHNYSSLKDAILSQINKVDAFNFRTHIEESEYGVIGRHGHEWDDNCHGYEFFKKVLKKDFSGDRFSEDCFKVQAIGEAVTAELLSGLLYRIAGDTQILNDIKSLAGRSDSLMQLKDINLKDINNVRPLTDALKWIEWFAKDGLHENTRALLLQKIRDSLKDLLDTSLARKWDELKPHWIVSGDITDHLQLVYTLSKVFELESLEWVLKFIESPSGKKDHYVNGAKQEWQRKLSQEFQYVVYGHTHEARQDYFKGDTNGKVQMYINTGTYLPLIQRTPEKGFAKAQRMTTVFFYRADEDKNEKKGKVVSVDIMNGIRRVS